jgi:hypothetical protein
VSALKHCHVALNMYFKYSIQFFDVLSDGILADRWFQLSVRQSQNSKTSPQIFLCLPLDSTLIQLSDYLGKLNYKLLQGSCILNSVHFLLQHVSCTNFQYYGIKQEVCCPFSTWKFVDGYHNINKPLSHIYKVSAINSAATRGVSSSK